MNEEVIARSKELLRVMRKKQNKQRRAGIQDSNANFGAVLPEGKTKYVVGKICHAGLGNNYGGDYQGALSVVSLITVDRIKEKRLAKGYTTPYYRWLLNVSPWKDVFITKCPKEAMKKGVILRTDVPSNLMNGALICSRYGWEGQGGGYTPKQQIYAWGELRKRGVDESFAFIMAHQARMNRGHLYWNNTNGGHEVISLHEMSRSSVKKFLIGEVPKQSLYNKTFQEKPQRSGINAIWGECGHLCTLLKREAENIGSTVKLKKRLLKTSRVKTTEPKEGFDHMAKWAKRYYKEIMA
ncbi:MAG: hypothetical protein JKY81_02465 [Colwellia sp.]|nr:hypothetical protein [Colwellia sp.]